MLMIIILESLKTVIGLGSVIKGMKPKLIFTLNAIYFKCHVQKEVFKMALIKMLHYTSYIFILTFTLFTTKRCFSHQQPNILLMLSVFQTVLAKRTLDLSIPLGLLPAIKSVQAVKERKNFACKYFSLAVFWD